MRNLVYIIFVAFTSCTLFASMPGWLTITDPDNNRYMVTPHGRIYTSEKPDFVYKPVSKEGITYYLNQGRILVNKYDPYEGLLILKSIRLLSSYDETLHYAGVKATLLINTMRKEEGDRFERLNKRASLLLCKTDDTVRVYNENAEFSFSWKGSLEVLKRMTHETHLYSADSIQFGLRLPGNEGETYNALMTGSFEKYTHGKIFDVDEYLEIRKEKKRPDMFEREVIKSTDKAQVSRIQFTKGDSRYSGIEAVFARKSGGGIVQIIAPSDSFPAVEEEINALLDSVEL